MIRSSRRFLALACALAFLSTGDAASGEPEWGAVAVPLRLVNLNPFHMLYGLPGSFGARVLPPGSSETVVSMDIVSHLAEARSGEERVLIDGETYRYATALRHGFRDGWEYLFEVSAVAHRGGEPMEIDDRSSVEEHQPIYPLCGSIQTATQSEP